MSKLTELLIKHEGKMNFPYEDTTGHISIGVGRNLTDRGLSDSEILMLLSNDLAISVTELTEAFSWFADLNEARQDALISMHYNLGMPKLLKFRKTLELLEQGMFEAAALEMLDSKWADQIGQRAKDLSKMIATGEYVGL
jgi:lysozyme